MIEKQSKQPEYEFVLIDNLVPPDHLLRKIDKIIDFSFIEEKVEHLYCTNNGRPGLNPTVLFKILFIGYLFGIRSERQLIREIQTNVAYRWFLNYKLADKIPHHSTLSRNRNERFAQSNIYQEIFDEIIFQAMDWKLVNGEVLYTDSTHLKANANKKKFTREDAQVSARSYIDELEEAVNNDRAEHGKKPLKKKEEEPAIKHIKVSKTDPESGHMVRDGKPKGFFFLDHRTVDGKCNIIVDSFVTAGNVHDSIPYLNRVDEMVNRYGFEVKAVGLDAGYNSLAICKGLNDREIFGTIGNRRFGKTDKEKLSKKEFNYNPQQDTYTCPQHQELTYRTTTREGYREYKSDPYICQCCPLLGQCTSSKNFTKVITRHIWENHRDKIKENSRSEAGREIYKRRKETVERSFANAKELHGHRYAKFRGLAKVQEQCFLAAACQNMKKIALTVFEISA